MDQLKKKKESIKSQILET